MARPSVRRPTAMQAGDRAQETDRIEVAVGQFAVAVALPHGAHKMIMSNARLAATPDDEKVETTTRRPSPTGPVMDA